MSLASKIVDTILEGVPDDAADFAKDFALANPLFPGTFYVDNGGQSWEVDGTGKVVKEFTGHRCRNPLADAERFDVREYVQRMKRKPGHIPLSAIGYWRPGGGYVPPRPDYS